MLFVIYMPVSAYRGDKFELRCKDFKTNNPAPMSALHNV